MTDINNGGTLIEKTIVFAINDLFNGHEVPSMSMGTTADGFTLMAKAVFADSESADRMAEHMNSKAGHDKRFEVVMVELWRPTDIEIYARKRAREINKEQKEVKLILPN